MKVKLDGLDINLNVKKEINHLITTNTTYHVLVKTTIQQLPEGSIILGRKWVIPSRQRPSAKYTIKLFSGIKIFSFYPQVFVKRDMDP